MSQQRRDAEVARDSCRVHCCVGGKDAANLGAWRQQFGGEGAGLQFAPCPWGVFLDNMILRAQLTGVGLLVNLALVARRMDTDALATMEHEMAQFVGDGEEACLRIKIVTQPDDAANLRLIPEPERCRRE